MNTTCTVACTDKHRFFVHHCMMLVKGNCSTVYSTGTYYSRIEELHEIQTVFCLFTDLKKPIIFLGINPKFVQDTSSQSFIYVKRFVRG